MGFTAKLDSPKSHIWISLASHVPQKMAINWMWPSISSASGSLSGSFIGSVAGAAEEDALVPGASHDKLRAIGATELTYGNVHSWQEIQCFQT